MSGAGARSGILVADKGRGATSFDVVAIVRRRLGVRRIGHAGTLDPDATGVLLVGVGNATRLLRFLSGADKTYTAEVVFGVETTTLPCWLTTTRRPCGRRTPISSGSATKMNSSA